MSDTSILQSHPRRWKVAYLLLFALGMSVVSNRIDTVSAQSPVFVGAGDIADCGRTQDQATALLLDGIAGTVFTAGDNVYPNGTTAEFNNCYHPTWGRHKARTRPSPGNHDYNSSGATPYYNYFGANAGPAGRGYYSYNLGAWHIISLNSEVPAGPGSVQEQWLRTDLAANTAACTLAYWHRPLFSSGSGHGNDPSTQALFEALYEFGADVVITGHDHNYERFAPQDPDGQADPTGIREFVVGTGGAALRPIGTIQPNSEVRNATTYGVLKLTLHPTSYNWEFIPITGQTFRDSGGMPCFTSGPPLPGTQVTLNVTDGWDSKNRKTLVQDGKLSQVTASDNSWVEVESNQFLSLQFRGVQANGTIQRARLYVEHHEEATFSANALVFQVGGGALTDPFVAEDLTPTVLLGEGNERTIEWDVTAWARTATRVNDLKLVVRNLDPNGKKVKIDRAYLVVTYGPPPSPPSSPVQVRLYATDGWDQKNQKTLVQDGKLYLAQGSDDQRGAVEAGFFVSYEFQGIPSSAVVDEVKLYVEHHEEEGIAANPLLWAAGGGLLTDPTTLVSQSPTVLSGPANEATIEWNVKTWINTAARVNDLKLRVRNNASNGKKTNNDRVYVVVTYHEP